MPLIRIKFEGHKTFGGYLTVDEGTNLILRDVKLEDGMLLQISTGFHQIQINSMNRNEIIANVRHRENANSAFFDEEWDKYERSINASINHEFNDTDLMTIVIVSGIKGEIIKLPEYSVNTLNIQEYDIYEKERRDNAVKEEAEREAYEAKTRPYQIIKGAVYGLFVGILGLLVLSAVISFVSGIIKLFL